MRVLSLLTFLMALNVQPLWAQCILDLGADTALFCEGSCVPIDAGSDWVSVSWSTGETTAAICAQQTGWHVATVTDAFACAASDSVFVIRLIHSAHAEEQEVCAGQLVEMRGLLSAEIQSIGSYNQITYLPDGSGVNYETNILVEDMPAGSVYEGGAGFLEICVNMEHSYLGDLEMMLTCPNGTSVNIFNAYTGNGLFPGGTGGGGTYLGQALDNGNGTPGVGWDYCFSDMATWGTLGNEYGDGNTVPAGGTTPGNAMAPGTYLPEDSFAALIGCPLNGDWTITIRDNQGIDDGYIMFWGIGIAADLGPVDYSWSNGDVSQTITAPVTETEMWVDMTLQGVMCSDTVSFVVNPLPEISLGITNSTCNESTGIIEPFFTDSFFIYLFGELDFPLPSFGLDPGLYNVSVYSPEGCISDTLIEISLAIDSVDNITGATVVFPSQEFTYSVPFSECLNYFWTIENGVIVSGQGTNEVTVFWNDSISGWISVSMSETRSFEQTVILYVGTATGIGEINAANIQLGPNPFTAEINISSDTRIHTAEVLDATGRVVFRTSNVNGTKAVLALESLQAGAYWLILETDKGRISEQIHKQ